MSISLSDHLTNTGRPYKWAQHLGGLSFSSYQQPYMAEDSHEVVRAVSSLLNHVILYVKPYKAKIYYVRNIDNCLFNIN